MRKIFTVISKFIAVLLSILFIVAMVLILLLVNLRSTLLSAETYKRALIEARAYQQLPALLAEGSSSLQGFLATACTDQALVCEMDSASPELQTCLMDSLGEQAYLEIGSRGREPTVAELAGSQPCLDQYASTTLQPETEAASPDDNPLSTVSAEVRACARQALGDETYEALYNSQRPPNKRETRRINACIRQVRRQARLDNPGIGGDLIVMLNDFSPEQWEQLIRTLLPADDLRHLTESALDQVFSYLNGESATASLSLVDLKAHLMGEAGDELILLLLNAQPPCTEEQQAQINAGNFENGGGTAIYCAASGETLTTMIPPMQNRLSKVAAQIPDEAVLIKPDAAGSANGFGRDYFSSIRTLRNWMWLSPIVTLSLLVLITVFGVRSVKGLLRWWGIPLFSAAVIALGIGLAAGPLLDWVWVNYAVPQFPPIISSGPAKLGYDVMSSVVHELGKWVMIEASLIAFVGLGAIIASRHSGPKLKGTARSFTPPELSSSGQEVEDRVRSRNENDSGYS
ncbi:MAG: hypothetical protein ACXW4U_12635 [Anaerolineales bacterium]